MGSAGALWIGHFLPWRPGRFRQEELEEVKTWQFRTGNGLGQGKYPFKSYVYSGSLVFTSEKASTRNDEAYEILFVRFDGKSKMAKSPTRQISKTPSVALRRRKSTFGEKWLRSYACRCVIGVRKPDLPRCRAQFCYLYRF